MSDLQDNPAAIIDTDFAGLVSGGSSSSSKNQISSGSSNGSSRGSEGVGVGVGVETQTTTTTTTQDPEFISPSTWKVDGSVVGRGVDQAERQE